MSVCQKLGKNTEQKGQEKRQETRDKLQFESFPFEDTSEKSREFRITVKKLQWEREISENNEASKSMAELLKGP